MRRTLRIIEFVSNFSQNDGMARVAYEIGRRLAKRHEVSAVYRHHSEIPFDFPAKRLGRREAIRYIASDADVVHTHFGLNLLLADAAKIYNPKLRHVFTHHVNPPLGITKSAALAHYGVYGATMLGVRLGVDKVVAISNYAKDDFLANYAKPAPTVIYNGVDTRAFRPDAKAGRAFREKYHIEASGFIAGYMNRFSPQKNHEMLLRAAKKMPKDTTVLLAGSEPKKGGTLEKCRSIAKSLNLEDRVKFIGKLPARDILGFYNCIDVLALPSLWEGFGLPVAEAMACARPVVCLGVFALPELVDATAKRNGFCVAGEKEFADALKKMGGDKKLRRAFGRNARKFALTIDWDIQAGKYEKLMAELAQ